MKLGTNDISSVYLGTNAVQKVYLGTNEVWSAFDADYQAILDYATTQGYTLPSASQQALQNQLVVDLKDAGVWSRLESFGVFATDGDSDFALIDWIRLTDFTRINSPTFTTNEGFQGDGVSNALNFNYVWGSSISVSNASMGQYYFSGTITNDIMGARFGFNNGQGMIVPNRFRLLCNNVDSVYTPNLGVDIHVRDSASTGFVRNGGANIIVNVLINNNKNNLSNYGLTAVNNSNSPVFFGQTNEIPISMSFFGQSLTTTQATDFDTAFSNYITSL